jgi:hypothetical protein
MERKFLFIPKVQNEFLLSFSSSFFFFFNIHVLLFFFPSALGIESRASHFSTTCVMSPALYIRF